MVAVISDIHGNTMALDAVLADMPKVSEIWVLGDTVGGGPFPGEALDKLLNLPTPVHAILGNWEERLIDAHNGLHSDWWGNVRHANSTWTVDALKPHHWDYIKSLPKTRIMDSIPGGALLYHGKPDDSAGKILEYEVAAEVASQHKEKWLLGGHVHRARMFRVGNQRVGAVGSVGLSIDKVGGVACYTLLDGENFTFRHVSYDLDKAISIYKNSELVKNDPFFTYAAAAVMLSGHGYVDELMDFIKAYIGDDCSTKKWLEAVDAWKLTLDGWLRDKIGW